jgi:hypothetical protein
VSGADRATCVTLVLHAHLSRYTNGRERIELPHEPGASLADYVRVLGIPSHEFYAVVRAGVVSSNLGAVPAAGEVVELLPALSGG